MVKHDQKKARYRKFDFSCMMMILTIYVLIVGSNFYVCKDTVLDLDNEAKLSSVISNITILEKDNSNMGSTVQFQIEWELWNPGPFAIKWQSTSTLWSFPLDFSYNNSSNYSLNYASINENNEGGLACSVHYIFPGKKHFNWRGWLNFVPNITDSNRLLPDGDFTFKLGDESWQKRYAYSINVMNNTLNHIPPVVPDNWGASSVNLGDPFWYIGALYIFLIILIQKRINQNRIKNNKSQEKINKPT